MNINVDQGEYDIAKEGYTITTGCAGPCILVGVYDKVQKQAYLIHEDSAAHGGMIQEFVKKITLNSDKADLIINIRGGSGRKRDPEFDAVIDNRNAVISYLKEFEGESQICIKWRISCMSINTVTGRFTYKC